MGKLTALREVVIEKLKKDLKCTTKQATELTDQYLMQMVRFGYCMPGDNYVTHFGENGQGIVLFGSVLKMLANGGFALVTPAGKKVAALILAADTKPRVNEEGILCELVYILSPEFGLGDLIVGLRPKQGVGPITILHGISNEEHSIVKALNSVVGWEW